MLFGLIFYALTDADDMLLLSISKAWLDKLLAICYQYSCILLGFENYKKQPII